MTQHADLDDRPQSLAAQIEQADGQCVRVPLAKLNGERRQRAVRLAVWSYWAQA